MASTNKTPQLGLNQWAAGDPVLREDFNGDNAKLDAAVGALQAHEFAYGSYTGNGTPGIPMSIHVGFKPEAVLVIGICDITADLMMFAIRGHDRKYGDSFLFRMTETGFDVCSHKESGRRVIPALAENVFYVYVAFR